MLTIDRFIEMKTGRDIRMLPDKLNHTIGQNYQLSGATLKATDLLFLLTNPMQEWQGDDIYATTNIINHTNRNQTIQLEILNNFVNRIIAYGTADFTYQDTVYVSNVLSKLGITNVIAFMREVKNVKENLVDIDQLIQVYERNLQFLKKTMQFSDHSTSKTKNEMRNFQERKNDYYLQNEIYSRLETKKIYEEVSYFSHPSQFFDTRILENQLSLSEQKKVFQQLKLMDLKTKAGVVEENVVDGYTNIYESHQAESHLSKRETVLSSASAGALINLIGNTVVHRIEATMKHRDVWMDMTQALYGAAENSIVRFQSFSSYYMANNRQECRNIEKINRLYKEELQAFAQLTDRRSFSVDHAIKKYENVGESPQPMEPELVMVTSEERTWNQENNTDITSMSTNQFEDVSHQDIHRENNVEENFLKQMREINEKNVLMHNHMLHQQVNQGNTNHIQTMDNRKTMAAALEAMAHPEKDVHEFFHEIEEEEKHPVDLVALYPQLTKMDEETRQVYEALLLMQHHPQRAAELGIVKKGNFGQLLRDLNENNRREGNVQNLGEHGETAWIKEETNRLTSEEISKQLTETFAMFTENAQEGQYPIKGSGNRRAGVGADDREEQEEPVTERTYLHSGSRETTEITERIENSINQIIPPVKRFKIDEMAENMEREVQIIHAMAEAGSPLQEMVHSEQQPDERREIQEFDRLQRILYRLNHSASPEEITPSDRIYLEPDDGEMKKGTEKLDELAASGQKWIQKTEVVDSNLDVTWKEFSDLKQTIDRMIQNKAEEEWDSSNMTVVQREDGIEKTTEQIRHTVSEIIKPSDHHTMQVVESMETVDHSIPLIHKKVNDIHEEILEEINKSGKGNEETVVSHVQDQTSVIHKAEINAGSKDVIERTSENIAAVIDRTITGQLDAITNKVYGKIERRLINERSRRGY